MAASSAASGSSSSSSARVGGQRPGQRDALGLPARQRAGPVAGVVGQADAVEPVGGRAAGLGLGDAPGAQPEGDVLQRGQLANSR